MVISFLCDKEGNEIVKQINYGGCSVLKVVYAALTIYVTVTRKRQGQLTLETNGKMSFNSISG